MACVGLAMAIGTGAVTNIFQQPLEANAVDGRTATIAYGDTFGPTLPTASGSVNSTSTLHIDKSVSGDFAFKEQGIYKGGSADYLMFAQNKGFLYNTENLGKITSVAVTYSSGCSTTAKAGVYFGNTQKTTYTTSSNATIKGQSKTDTWTNSTDGYGYFQLSTSNKNCQITQIVVTYNDPSTFNVYYDGNGNTSGSAPSDATGYVSGASVTVLGNSGNLAKTGYSFNGWNTRPDGTGTSYSAGGTLSITKCLTLYAQWAVASSISLSTSSSTIVKGDTLDISSYVVGATGTLSYVSKNTSVATVNSAGVITASSSNTGNATITVTDSGTDTSADFTITVRNPYTYAFGLGDYYLTVLNDSTTYWLNPQAHSAAPAGNSATSLNLDATTVTKAWTIAKATNANAGDDHYQITDGTNYLYLLNDNNGVRTQTSEPDSYWTITTSDTSPDDGFDCTLTYATNSRKLAVNTGTSDFRCYTTSSGLQTITVVPVKTLNSLSLSGTQSTTTGFKAGGSFVRDGTVAATANFTYANGSKNYDKDVTSSVTWTPSPLTAGAAVTVTAHYTYRGVEKTADLGQTINVAEATVELIDVTTNPSKTTYKSGENFDISALVVTGYDGEMDAIGNVTASCTYKVGAISLVPGSAISSSITGTVTVTVIYNGDENITDSFTITVTPYIRLNASLVTGSNSYSTTHTSDNTFVGTYHSLIEAKGIYNNAGTINVNKDNKNYSTGYVKNLAALPGEISKVTITFGSASSNNIPKVYFASTAVATTGSSTTVTFDDGANTVVSKSLATAGMRYFYVDFDNISTSSPISIVSIDVDYVQDDESVARNFADYYLHMNDYSSNLGYCLDSSDQHYYSTAKTAFASLTSDQKEYFLLLDGAVARLQKWALANNESFDGETGVFSPAALVSVWNSPADTESTSLLILIVSSSIVVCSGLLVVCRKRRQADE